MCRCFRWTKKKCIVSIRNPHNVDGSNIFTRWWFLAEQLVRKSNIFAAVRAESHKNQSSFFCCIATKWKHIPRFITLYCSDFWHFHKIHLFDVLATMHQHQQPAHHIISIGIHNSKLGVECKRMDGSNEYFFCRFADVYAHDTRWINIENLLRSWKRALFSFVSLNILSVVVRSAFALYSWQSNIVVSPLRSASFSSFCVPAVCSIRFGSLSLFWSRLQHSLSLRFACAGAGLL